ncbi:hypothetical protein CCUS01_11532 [Colletotrichum cuscutae]|uniref:Secreted protein n=1 Tax=Colletotrichum cuscutae TaxID=1209917 RepID=A0AAI9TZ36_9PEZI|nr:hypothetical protein CCUS01_11532 [Colletotrichum cuscutae]
MTFGPGILSPLIVLQLIFLSDLFCLSPADRDYERRAHRLPTRTMTTRRDRIASTSSRPAYNSSVFACPSSTSPSVSSQYSTRPTQRTSAGTTNDAGTLAQLSLQPHRTPHIHIELFCRPTSPPRIHLSFGRNFRSLTWTAQ